MRRAVAAVAAVAVVCTGVAVVGVASANRPSVATSTTLEATTPTPVTNGPLTVALVDTHHSDAASQLVVVLEITATTTLVLGGRAAVYVGPDGQQVAVTGYIEPERVFGGATTLSVMVFPAASPGGTVMYHALADNTLLEVSIPVQIEHADPIGTGIPEDPSPPPRTEPTTEASADSSQPDSSAPPSSDGAPVTTTTSLPTTLVTVFPTVAPPVFPTLFTIPFPTVI